MPGWNVRRGQGPRVPPASAGVALADPEHRYHDLYAEVKPHITGACQYCANACGVKPAVVDEGIALLKEHRGHPSLRGLVADGFEVLTF